MTCNTRPPFVYWWVHTASIDYNMKSVWCRYIKGCAIAASIDLGSCYIVHFCVLKNALGVVFHSICRSCALRLCVHRVSYHKVETFHFQIFKTGLFNHCVFESIFVTVSFFQFELSVSVHVCVHKRLICTVISVFARNYHKRDKGIRFT